MGRVADRTSCRLDHPQLLTTNACGSRGQDHFISQGIEVNWFVKSILILCLLTAIEFIDSHVSISLAISSKSLGLCEIAHFANFVHPLQNQLAARAPDVCLHLLGERSAGLTESDDRLRLEPSEISRRRCSEI